LVSKWCEPRCPRNERALARSGRQVGITNALSTSTTVSTTAVEALRRVPLALDIVGVRWGREPGGTVSDGAVGWRVDNVLRAEQIGDKRSLEAFANHVPGNSSLIVKVGIVASLLIEQRASQEDLIQYHAKHVRAADGSPDREPRH
jgi:hypothetical protein